LADRYITGICPHCKYEKAYGDQCENCGISLNATDLINPKSVLTGNNPIRKKTKHWYLPLDKYEDGLRKWIESHKNDWRTTVYGQCKSWLDIGLQPRAVTRDLDWGVKVPIENAEGKVLYVWFDAPIGYISATKELTPEWEKYWKDEDSKLVHFIGKDNIVFHCIIFPSMLKAEGSYILPDNVPANEFLNLEGDKISTSRNWAVWLHEYLEDFKGKEDVLRYVLTANAPETKDNDFTWKDFQARNNNELLAVLGNFINRTLVLTHKYFDGIVPAISELSQKDKDVFEELSKCPEKISKSIEKYRFREALNEYMNIARLGNKYLTDSEPWKIFKENPEKVKTILNVSLQIVANLAVFGEIFLPFTSKKILDMINLQNIKWINAGKTDLLKAGCQLKPAELLFSRIEDIEIQQQIDKLKKTKEENISNDFQIKDFKTNIEFEDFTKIDIRVGTILKAEKVPKTKKLLKLLIDTGIDKRIIVSGIAEFYNTEDIIGKKVSVLVNLAPKKIKGIISNGMILMVENFKGELSFLGVDKNENVEDGSEVC